MSRVAIPLTLLLILTFLPVGLTVNLGQQQKLSVTDTGRTQGVQDEQENDNRQVEKEQISDSVSGQEQVLPVTITKTLKVYLTFYGYPDNDPPNSKHIAYPSSRSVQSLHQEAGGAGTFADPITVAAKTGAWEVGTKFYLPFLKKYLILEDICAGCTDNHLDAWMESDDAFVDKLKACQASWTKKDLTAEVDPPPR